jgi:DNA modification methylase
MDSVNLQQGNWEELVKDIPDKSVDLIFSDLPYASKTFGKCVDCKWDTPIDLDKLWIEIKRIRRDDHVPIFMCCNMKFAVDLINSNKKEFRYDLIWVKSAPCSFLSARKMPMKKHELVLVFYKKLPFYDLSSHTHKFIKSKTKKEKADGIYGDVTRNRPKDRKGSESYYNPPLPKSVVNEYEIVNNETKEVNIKGLYGQVKINQFKKRNEPYYDPPLPTSVLETDGKVKDDSDTLYGNINTPDYIKNNISRNELRRKYKKEGKSESVYDPPLPTSVLDEPTPEIDKLDDETIKKLKEMALIDIPTIETTDVETDVDTDLNIIPAVKSDCYSFTERLKSGKLKKSNVSWDPPLPTTIIEEKRKGCKYTDKEKLEMNAYHHPDSSILPATILRSSDYNGGKVSYDPPLPVSVIEDTYKDIILEPPDTLLRIKSQKGKHATQKPTDLMKWVFKYYSKEGDVIFDPTMGSGSTGVAAIQMNRKFIGFELDEEIFKVAQQRILIDKN